MSDDTRLGGLQTIFSFFLGLMLTAFVGVGAYTFHPPPTALRDQVNELSRKEQAVRGFRPEEQLTAADREALQQLSAERERVQEERQAADREWGKSTSIIIIVLATLAMAFSLVRADQLPVLSNGLLAGGVFTMLYGIGWIIASDQSVARFIVITIALALTIVLGYFRFVRRGRPPATSAAAAATGESTAELEYRVSDLERRMDEAARVLQPRRPG